MRRCPGLRARVIAGPLSPHLAQDAPVSPAPSTICCHPLASHVVPFPGPETMLLAGPPPCPVAAATCPSTPTTELPEPSHLTEETPHLPAGPREPPPPLVTTRWPFHLLAPLGHSKALLTRAVGSGWPSRPRRRHSACHGFAVAVSGRSERTPGGAPGHSRHAALLALSGALYLVSLTPSLLLSSRWVVGPWRMPPCIWLAPRTQRRGRCPAQGRRQDRGADRGAEPARGRVLSQPSPSRAHPLAGGGHSSRSRVFPSRPFPGHSHIYSCPCRGHTRDLPLSLATFRAAARS